MGESGRSFTSEAELAVQSVVSRLHGSRMMRTSQEGLQMRSWSMTRNWKIMSQSVKGVRVLTRPLVFRAIIKTIGLDTKILMHWMHQSDTDYPKTLLWVVQTIQPSVFIEDLVLSLIHI